MVKAPEVQVKDGTATATLKFAKPQPDYASPAQVTLLLNQVFQKLDVQKFKLEPAKDAESHEGRFSEMVLTLDDPIPADDLKAALETVKTDFQSTPQPERLENFDSQLARDTQQKALYAILASWVAILLYLWFRFGSWTFGAATVLCLIHDLFFTLGAIALCHYIYVWAPGVAYYLGIADFKIDLTSVAALLTLVGYSVSDTIVVFDRIREVRGKNPLLTYTMINDSVNQTLSRTILSSLTVFLVVGVLYVFGGEGVHLFSFVMVVGVIVGTYSSIYIASPLLIVFGEGTPRTERDRAAAAAAADAAAAAARA
jgi:SecD/SecF fusion protein